MCLQAKDLGHLTDYRALRAAVMGMGTQVMFFSVLLVRRKGIRRGTSICRLWRWCWLVLVSHSHRNHLYISNHMGDMGSTTKWGK